MCITGGEVMQGLKIDRYIGLFSPAFLEKLLMKHLMVFYSHVSSFLYDKI